MSKKTFFKEEFPALLDQVKQGSEANFGLMTAQHMVEHLTYVMKSSIKRYGEPPAEPVERHQKFKQFIANGAVLKHRPSDKTKDDLPELKYESIEEAKPHVAEAIDRFYNFFEANPEFKPYSPFMGELSFDEIEHFHYMHFRYHLWQFGVLESYP